MNSAVMSLVRTSVDDCRSGVIHSSLTDLQIAADLCRSIPGKKSSLAVIEREIRKRLREGRR